MIIYLESTGKIFWIGRTEHNGQAHCFTNGNEFKVAEISSVILCCWAIGDCFLDNTYFPSPQALWNIFNHTGPSLHLGILNIFFAQNRYLYNCIVLVTVHAELVSMYTLLADFLLLTGFWIRFLIQPRDGNGNRLRDKFARLVLSSTNTNDSDPNIPFACQSVLRHCSDSTRILYSGPYRVDW